MGPPELKNHVEAYGRWMASFAWFYHHSQIFLLRNFMMLRQRKGTPKAKPKHRHPTCVHSLRSENPHLPNCWARNHEGLIAAAARHRLERHLVGGLHQEDHGWLMKHKGRFPHFVHPEVPSFKHLYQRVKFENESMQEFVDRFNQLPADSSVARHRLAGPSPRCNVRPNTQDNFETAL